MWCTLVFFALFALMNSVINANISIKSSKGSDTDETILVSYTLWIGTDAKEDYQINLEVAPRTRFYEVMEKAADLDPTFAFKAVDYPTMGHFITEIGNVKNDEKNSTYWMIYILPNSPNKTRPPTDKYLSPVGVDEIKVKEGKNYLFWYKYVKIQQ